MDKLTVRDLDVAHRQVFVRVDYNVPLEGGRITDDTRIRASLPTLRLLLERGARLVLASHLGRPKGAANPKYSLRPLVAPLAERLGRPVAFAEDCIGAAAEGAAARLRDGDVLLLENLRFHAEEEKNEPGFAAALGRLGSLYVDDAFGASHRAHASIEGITHHVEKAAAGLLLEDEVVKLGRAVVAPERPFALLLGGAKVSDKIEVIEGLLGKIDRLLIGGGMAFTLLKAAGLPIGRSLVELDKVELAARILADAKARGVEVRLPVDHVVAPSVSAGAEARAVEASAMPEELMALDIGPRTIEEFRAALRGARTVVWNGPMGVFETAPFERGTVAVAHAVAESGAYSVVGGGDSVAALKVAGVEARIGHVSTGGGASLEFLSGRTLPGVAALSPRG